MTESFPPEERGKNGQELDLEKLGPANAPGSTSPRMLVPLFVVPLVIVGVIVGVFLALGSVLGKEKSVPEWIAEFESGGVNERWQAAAQLSEIALVSPEKLADPSIREKLRDAFRTAGPTEPRIRQYLAQLWAAIGDEEATPLIVEGIDRVKELIQHRSTRPPGEIEQAEKELASYVSALGAIGNPAAEAKALELAADPDPKVRQSVASALGDIARKAIRDGGNASPASTAALLRLYQDDDPWVRMNAALGLGKAGRTEGVATLEAMLDRAWLRSQNLQFPDDGNYAVSQHDPAGRWILFAMLTLKSLIEGASGGPELDRGSLRAAVDKASRDPNPDVQRRAKELLATLPG